MSQQLNISTVNRKLEEIIVYHQVNITLGIICVILSLALLYCLLTNQTFRHKNKLVICLAFADFINCIGITLMGIDRVKLYKNVLDGGAVDQENSWSCGIELWLFVRTIGDLWPPVIQLSMGLDQYLSSYKWDKSEKKQIVLVTFTIFFVLLFILMAYVTSYINRSAGPVKYHCGRKAAFGRIISGLIYAHNVIGYALGVILNTLAFIKLKKTSYDESDERQKKLQYVRSCLTVSCISTVLVSLPNMISLCSLLITSVRDSISKPAVWATCLNSGVNIFVYFFVNDEFRAHCNSLIDRKTNYDVDQDVYYANYYLHRRYTTLNPDFSNENSTYLSCEFNNITIHNNIKFELK